MKPSRIITALLFFVLCGHVLAQDIDTELSNMTERLAVKIKAKDMKRVAVIDFTDLQGGSSDLGKYIAEQMTVDFAMTNRDFSILDRANLKKILAEHKLTSLGLIDPDNAKKLGQFAGVDAIILGTIIPKGQNISLTAKIITTETAEIVGADKAGFKTDDTVKQLMSQAVTESSTGGGSAGGSDNETAKVTKSLDDLRVELQSLTIVNNRQYLLTMKLSNQAKQRNIYVALHGGMTGNAHGSVFDPDGFEFVNGDQEVTGVASTMLQIPSNAFTQATKIAAGDSVSVTVQFHSMQSRTATTGNCKVQLEFLLGYDFNNNYGSCTAHSFSAKIDAE
jgi:curli biogenesis system outer membrane secretion channel CsgG